jgi:hypothetical protein
MEKKIVNDVYETPRASVRGVFLCDGIAVPVSVLTLGITQEGWGNDVVLGDTDANGDLWLEF